MKQRAGFFILSFCGAAAVQAQTVRGTVQDAVTHQPVAGATIRVASDSLAWRATTDSAGAFSVRLPRPGLFTIEATRIGYRQQGDTVRVDDGETVALRIELAENAVTLHPVVVVARHSRLPEGFEQRRAMGFGRFLDPTDNLLGFSARGGFANTRHPAFAISAEDGVSVSTVARRRWDTDATMIDSVRADAG